VVEEIRTGALHLSLPQDENDAARAAAPTPKALLLELINAKTWLTGKRALLQVAVRNRTNQAVQGAKVTARVDGAAAISEYSTETGPFGHAQLEFAMPRLAGAEPALVIEASHGNARGHLRFQLRTKPRVPSAS
jgi:hypothetical protein